MTVGLYMLRTLRSLELQRHPICLAICGHGTLLHAPCFNTHDPAVRAPKGLSDSPVMAAGGGWRKGSGSVWESASRTVRVRREADWDRVPTCIHGGRLLPYPRSVLVSVAILQE